MFYSDNPVADAEGYSAHQEKELRKLPTCACCGEHIQQEDAVRVNGDFYCDDCLDNMRECIDFD